MRTSWTAGSIQGALYFTADNATNDDSIGDLPNLPVPISYPQYGGFALLPLEGPNYTAQVSLVPHDRDHAFCAVH